jgi:hypothetical protein
MPSAYVLAYDRFHRALREVEHLPPLPPDASPASRAACSRLARRLRDTDPDELAAALEVGSADDSADEDDRSPSPSDVTCSTPSCSVLPQTLTHSHRLGPRPSSWTSAHSPREADLGFRSAPYACAGQRWSATVQKTVRDCARDRSDPVALEGIVREVVSLGHSTLPLGNARAGGRHVYERSTSGTAERPGSEQTVRGPDCVRRRSPASGGQPETVAETCQTDCSAGLPSCIPDARRRMPTRRCRRTAILASMRGKTRVTQLRDTNSVLTVTGPDLTQLELVCTAITPTYIRRLVQPPGTQRPRFPPVHPSNTPCPCARTTRRPRRPRHPRTSSTMRPRTVSPCSCRSDTTPVLKRSRAPVTADSPPTKNGGLPGKRPAAGTSTAETIIRVQPLKRSEMQVRDSRARETRPPELRPSLRTLRTWGSRRYARDSLPS